MDLDHLLKLATAARDEAEKLNDSGPAYETLWAYIDECMLSRPAPCPQLKVGDVAAMIETAIAGRPSSSPLLDRRCVECHHTECSCDCATCNETRQRANRGELKPCDCHPCRRARADYARFRAERENAPKPPAGQPIEVHQYIQDPELIEQVKVGQEGTGSLSDRVSPVLVFEDED
jgi:hypothetical protein